MEHVCIDVTANVTTKIQENRMKSVPVDTDNTMGIVLQNAAFR
jgi:hypothetical protein